MYYVGLRMVQWRKSYQFYFQSEFEFWKRNIFENQAFTYDQKLVFERDSLHLSHCRFRILKFKATTYIFFQEIILSV